MPPKKRSAPLSLRAYAERRGVSAEAVSKAIRTGRLRASVTTVGGAPKIADAELADREWEANTTPRVDQPEPPAPRSARASRQPARVAVVVSADEDDDGDLPANVPPYKVSRAKREAEAARREAALADLAEIEVAEKREELIPAEEAKAYIVDRFTLVKTKLLGIPSRVAQQLPNLAHEVEPVVERLIREALEELAADVESDGDDEVE